MKPLIESLESEEYDTATRGHRTIESARPCGEGVYGIVKHKQHTHLAFVLEVPEVPGAVQESLNIPKEGSYIVAIKNPDRTSQKWPGIPASSKATYDSKLANHFLGRAFIPCSPSSFLDYKGCELILIGASDDLAIDLADLGKGFF